MTYNLWLLDIELTKNILPLHAVNNTKHSSYIRSRIKWNIKSQKI